MRIPLNEWAKKRKISKQRAWQLFKAGRLKTAESGTITTIEENEEYALLRRGRVKGIANYQPTATKPV